jgi:hypothetical protein
MTDSDIQNIKKSCAGYTPPADKPHRAKPTKADKLLKPLKSKRGATIDQLQEASGWQSHSVRGFLSGTVKRKLGLTLVSDTGKDGRKRYRVDDGAAGE